MAARSLDEELEQLYDNSLDAVLIAGLDGFLRRANRGFARLLRYSPEELLARPFMDNLHPGDVEAVRAALAELAAGKDMISFECRLMTADGWVRWTEWDATPRLDEGVVFAIGRDVTERHIALEQVGALRRVATLVAEVTQPRDLFARVAAEVARVVDVPAVSIASYEPDDSVVYLAVSEEGEGFGVGKRQPLDGTSVVAEIRRTHEPARIDDYSGLDGRIAELMRRSGGRSTVGSPIVVAGRLWGAMVVSTSAPEPLPPDTEARLADFTELLGAAIANAESREAVERLADEQAALRRVATLIAQGVPPAKIFAAVSDEVDELFDCGAGVARFEDDGPATVFAGVSKRITVPIGTRFAFQDGMASVEVYRTHQSARVDRNDWSTDDGALATTARRVGLVSSVASPIVVDGHLWGTMNLWSTDEPLPPDTADRLEKFTDLVATAIANAEAREALERLADEQAALRRVATLAAQSVHPTEIFSAVSREVAQLFDTDAAYVGRFDPDGPAIIAMGVANLDPEITVGARWELDDAMSTAEVLRTGRSARVDGADWSSVTAPIGALAQRLGTSCAVSSPITVEGRLWGAMSVAAREPLPPDTADRLEKFTALVATAIANAESREALERLAEEQAALRRVATLAAQATHPTEIFSAVSREVAQLFGTDAAYVGRFDPDGPALVAVGVATADPEATVGSRWVLDDSMSTAEVLRTGRSARVDDADWSSNTAPIGALVRRLEVSCSVSSPITVEGRLWGTITLAATEPLPPDTADRLERFTALVATAIANAESREAVERLAEEQAALRRVATLAVQAVHPAEIFSAVSREVGQLFGENLAAVGRFDLDSPTITLVGMANDVEGVAVGMRVEVNEETPAGRVYMTGRSARVDRADWSAAGSQMGKIAERLAVVSSVSSPIVVEGRLWGAMSALATTKPLPADTELRLERFSELVALTIANAESRDALEQMAAEQSALRRVATLVARGVPASRIFMAVSEEVGQLFGENLAAVGRFDVDERAITCVGTNVQGLAVGTRVELTDETLGGRVYATGRSVRVDRADGSAAWPPMGKIPDQVGVVSAVSSPIIVEGRLWGAISALATSKPLPADTEERLERFGDLLATAIANAESKSELAASRRRIVAASDEARRRIERDLHDGTQQRLVALGLAVRNAEAGVPEERDDLRSELSRIATGLTDAVTELQEMSRGIHPAILSKGGLASALRALARRSAVPVELDITTDARLPEPIEVAAYYVASEAIANATKHAHASQIDMSLATCDGGVQLSVRDDGVGGADARRGSGLVGLGDRVEAVGGSIRVESPRGGGTHITAELPLGLESQTSSNDL